MCSDETMQAPPMHLYLHSPYCVHKCPYCDFNSLSGRQDEQADYVQAMLKEISQLPPGPYETLFFGGGTPTYLNHQHLKTLLNGIRQHIQLADGYEWTCEANPASSDADQFALLAEYGVNRLSIGVQSIHQHHLTFLGRAHSVGEAHQAVDLAKRYVPRVNADLIIGLPDQTFAELEREIEFYRFHDLDHASVYHLAIEQGTEFYARHQRGELTTLDEEQSHEYLRYVWQALTALGLEGYETSNFAKPGQACRHNLAYWRQKDYYAAGAGAVSTIGSTRITREKHPAQYIRAMNNHSSAHWRTEQLSTIERLTECWMLGLRLIAGVNRQDLQDRGDKESRWLPIAEQLCAQGLCSLSDESLSLTKSGRFVQDQVTIQLLPD